MCKDSRFVTVKSAHGAYLLQVNMPLSLKPDKVDDFTKALQDMADLATIDEDGKVLKHAVMLIDDLPTVYAVSMGIVTIDRKNMTGVAVLCKSDFLPYFASSGSVTGRGPIKLISPVRILKN